MIAAQTTNNRMAKKNTSGPKVAKQSGVGKANSDAAAQNATLNTTLEQIEKAFGQGAIMPLGSENDRQIDGIQTGSLSLDLALGGQGIPRGRIIEIYGPESSGKTTLA